MRRQARPCPSHEGDTTTNQYLSATVAQACNLALDVMDDAVVTLPVMHPNTARISQNVEASREAMAMESLMMRLAKNIGRPRAHDIVPALSREATTSKRPLVERLKTDTSLTSQVSEREIDDILFSEINTGQCGEITRQAVAAARANVVNTPHTD